MNFPGKLLLVILSVAAVSLSQNVNHAKTTDQNQKGPTIKLENGLWFNGQTFVERTVWVHKGRLYFNIQAASTDTTIDLSGTYVIPPFAEAHNHNLESDYRLQERINSYLEDGVFYVKHLSSIKKRIDPLMNHYNKPGGLDISLAHAPLTATGGHSTLAVRSFDASDSLLGHLL